jgi:hypothetical protein
MAGLMCCFSPLAWGFNSAITNSQIQNQIRYLCEVVVISNIFYTTNHVIYEGPSIHIWYTRGFEKNICSGFKSQVVKISKG